MVLFFAFLRQHTSKSLKNDLPSDPRTDRFGKQTRKCLFSGARREFISPVCVRTGTGRRRGELKNVTLAFFNILLAREPLINSHMAAKRAFRDAMRGASRAVCSLHISDE
jgi:hypothetical protein